MWRNPFDGDDELDEYAVTDDGHITHDKALVRRQRDDEELEEAMWTSLQEHLDERKGYERDVQSELAEEIADLKDDLLIATPSRLAIFLTPKLFGHGAEFRLDPWLALLEQRAIAKLRSPDQEFLGVNAVAQAGKTTYCGLYLPFWISGFFPGKRQIKIAYSESLAGQTGRVLRDLIKVYGPALFGIDIDPDNEKVTDFSFRGHSGGVLSAGVGGSITGRSGDFIQIDDLLKNMQEAGSRSQKDYLETEYYGTIRTRLQPGGFMLLSATRFAVDDPTGRLKAKQAEPGYDGDNWEWLKFDAIATPDRHDPKRFDDDWRDQLGRKRGEPLLTRFDPNGVGAGPEDWEGSYFYGLRRAFRANPSSWQAIYQQNPTNPTGGMFPEAKWRYYDPAAELPPMIAYRRVWDLAATEGGGDWTVGALVGKSGNDFYVLALSRFQKAADDVQAEVVAGIARDGFAVPIMIEEEKGGSGKHNTAFFQRLLAPAYVKPAKAEGKKEDRARPYSGLQQTGHVFLPKSPDGATEDLTPDWLDLFVDEHAAMMGDGRAGPNDDIIDCVAYAINDMLDAGEAEIQELTVGATAAGMAVASALGRGWGR